MNEISMFESCINQLKKASTPNLIGIDVQKNQISSFENSTFLNLKTMTHLLLNDNLIEEIPDYSFQDLGSLQELHLQNVSIEMKNRFLKILIEPTAKYHAIEFDRFGIS